MIFYTAMQGLRRIMEKPHGSTGRWSPRQEIVVEVGRSGVAPIAFRIRENKRVRGPPIFLRKHPPLFSSLQASLLVFSGHSHPDFSYGAASECKLLKDSLSVSATWFVRSSITL